MTFQIRLHRCIHVIRVLAWLSAPLCISFAGLARLNVVTCKVAALNVDKWRGTVGGTLKEG